MAGDGKISRKEGRKHLVFLSELNCRLWHFQQSIWRWSNCLQRTENAFPQWLEYACIRRFNHLSFSIAWHFSLGSVSCDSGIFQSCRAEQGCWISGLMEVVYSPCWTGQLQWNAGKYFFYRCSEALKKDQCVETDYPETSGLMSS